MWETKTPADFAGLRGDLTGTDDGRAPLVLLHGLTYDRRTWRPVLDELDVADPGRRVLNLDLPAHGESPARASYRMADSVAAVHDAVSAAGLDAPVLVGHSISGGIASLYAGVHPTRGVVNVDSPPDVSGVAAMLQANAAGLRGPGFPDIWAAMSAGFRLDRLPAASRAVVAASSRPDQAVALGYWADLFEMTIAEANAMVDNGMAAARARGVPYLLLVGSPLDPATAAKMAREVPAAVVETWPDTGHFPHLARPAEFARLLARTAAWTAGSAA